MKRKKHSAGCAWIITGRLSRCNCGKVQHKVVPKNAIELVCPFCNKRTLGVLPMDCTRCEAQDGPGSGTPMVKYEGFDWKHYKPVNAIDQLNLERKGRLAAEREAERLRHGFTIESDFICPNELEAYELRQLLYDFVFACDERGLTECRVVTDYDGYTPNNPGHQSIFGGAPVQDCKMCRAIKIYNNEPDKDKCPPLENS